MTKIRKLVRDLLSLINKSELSDQQTTKIKNLICYLSEARKNNEISPDDIALVENTLFSASMKLRTFGYNRLNGLLTEKILPERLGCKGTTQGVKYEGTRSARRTIPCKYD